MLMGWLINLDNECNCDFLALTDLTLALWPHRLSYTVNCRTTSCIGIFDFHFDYFGNFDVLDVLCMTYMLESTLPL